jgi:hypothetical protein
MIVWTIAIPTYFAVGARARFVRFVLLMARPLPQQVDEGEDAIQTIDEVPVQPQISTSRSFWGRSAR